jgi:hypothetical protein
MLAGNSTTCRRCVRLSLTCDCAAHAIAHEISGKLVNSFGAPKASTAAGELVVPMLLPPPPQPLPILLHVPRGPPSATHVARAAAAWPVAVARPVVVEQEGNEGSALARQLAAGSAFAGGTNHLDCEQGILRALTERQHGAPDVPLEQLRAWTLAAVQRQDFSLLGRALTLAAAAGHALSDLLTLVEVACLFNDVARGAVPGLGGGSHSHGGGGSGSSGVESAAAWAAAATEQQRPWSGHFWRTHHYGGAFALPGYREHAPLQIPAVRLASFPSAAAAVVPSAVAPWGGTFVPLDPSFCGPALQPATWRHGPFPEARQFPDGPTAPAAPPPAAPIGLDAVVAPARVTKSGPMLAEVSQEDLAPEEAEFWSALSMLVTD